MAKLAELRKRAKELGVAPSVIRGATSVSELQDVIDNFEDDEKPRKKVGKKAAKKTTKTTTGKKRGRPKGSKNSTKSASKSKAAPAGKSSKGKAKRPSAAKSSSGSAYVPKGGRNMLDEVDFTDDEGWNAREGSAPDRIVKALRKFKGNRSKVFDYLVDDIWDFVGKKKRDGSKRGKGEAENYLRYRIARTAWDFAIRTGQHEKATNRVEYGTGGTGAGVFKPAKKSGKKAAKPTKTTAATGRKRGRPKGSKNKVKRGRPKAKA